MLFSTSPVKSISEKIKPLSESGKGKVSRLKFDRKNDYKTFLNFIKKNTRDLEEQQVKKEKKTSTGAFGIIGLGLLGGLFGGGKKDDNAFKTSFIPKALQRAKLDAESQAKKKKDASGGTAFASIPKAFFKFKKDIDTTYRNIGVGRKERTREKVKSKQKVKESIVNQERVYNRNRKKRLTLKQKQLTAAGGMGSGNQKLLPDQAKSIKDKKIKSIVGRASQSDGGKLNKSDLAKILGIDESKLNKTTDIGAEIEASKITKKGDNIVTRIGRKVKRKFTQLNLPFKNTSVGDVMGTDIETPTPSNVKRQITDQVLNETLQGRKRNAKDAFKSLGLDTPEGLKNKIKVNEFIDQLELKTQEEDIEYDKQKKDRLKNIKKIKSEKMLNKNLNRITNFTNRVFNSPAYKFGTFIGGMMANYKLEIVKQLLTPTPLADGTMKGRSGVIPAAEELMLDKETSVNVFNFSEGRESMIPFDANVKLPSVSKPEDLQTPTNEIFVDFEFDTTEDLFFMKMGGS